MDCDTSYKLASQLLAILQVKMSNNYRKGKMQMLHMMINSDILVMISSGPLADSHEIKGFYKGYFMQNKGCFIEILTKIKSKLT